MTRTKEFFGTLDESWQLSVRLGDDKEISVMGEGMIAISSRDGILKLLHNVQYVLRLVHNLLSME